jgi:hypothetical protein
MAGRIRGNPPSLDARSLARLQAAGPTPDQIFNHMDDLNEEIEEQAEADGVELMRADAEEVDMTDQEDELDRINRELEQKLARQRELEAQRAAQEAENAPQAQAPVSEEMDIEDQVRQMLSEQEGAPSPAQIEKWKRQFGQDAVQVLAMGKGDVYVFTYLRRAAFQKIQTAMAKQAQLDGMSKDPEEFMMEQVLKQCVLWPKLQVEFFYNSRSGVIPTIYSSIMLHSYHLTPQQAMVITAQL